MVLEKHKNKGLLNQDMKNNLCQKFGFLIIRILEDLHILGLIVQIRNPKNNSAGQHLLLGDFTIISKTSIFGIIVGELLKLGKTNGNSYFERGCFSTER